MLTAAAAAAAAAAVAVAVAAAAAAVAAAAVAATRRDGTTAVQRMHRHIDTQQQLIVIGLLLSPS